MNITLWIVQGLLALLFLMAGGMKMMQPKDQILEKMGERMGWMEDFSQNTIRGIGLLEVLGALGLILPPLTGILPILAPLAAVGLVLTMIGAAMTHLRRGEMQSIAPNAILLLLALFVVYGRFITVPF